MPTNTPYSAFLSVYDPRNNANEEHLAVQVGGLTTIYNTGINPIQTGDVVLWDMPETDDTEGTSKVRIAGVPKNKLLFSTKALRPTDAFKLEKKEYYTMLGFTNKAEWPRREGDQGYISDAEVFHRLNRRIIGRAFSSAKSAKPFDILLGRYMT